MKKTVTEKEAFAIVVQLLKESQSESKDTESDFWNMKKLFNQSQVRLKEAEKVIGFYGDKTSWTIEGKIIDFTDYSHEVATSSLEWKCGGNSARQYLDKYKVEK